MLSRHTETVLLEIKGDLGEIKGAVKQIDNRVERLEKHHDRQPARVQDLTPLLWGALAMALASSGKIPWSAVLDLARRG